MAADEVIAIPRFALVVLMGPSSSGKSTFAKKWFKASAIVSADQCRWMVADEESAEWASAEAFALLETWVMARLKLGLLTVVDANGLEPRFRLRMLDLAREFHAPALLLSFEPSLNTLMEYDRRREKVMGAEALERQLQRFARATAKVREEGWNRVVHLRDAELKRLSVQVRPLRVDCTVPPPYDLIGDVHGCYLELTELLQRLGYRRDERAGYRHPAGRRVIFVGDLIDRGPASLPVLKLAMQMQKAGSALVNPGNHDDKLLRYLSGGKVRVDHGFERTVAELEALSADERRGLQDELLTWLRSLPPYLLLDQGRLVVAHAGLPEHLQGRLSRAVVAWALFGEARTTRPTPGQPERVDWPITYHGKAMVIYGHTPSGEARRRGNTLCIDQGCVFGGKLTAYRYPEGELVQVKAQQTWYPDDAPDLDGCAPGEGESSEGGSTAATAAADAAEAPLLEVTGGEPASLDVQNSAASESTSALPEPLPVSELALTADHEASGPLAQVQAAAAAHARELEPPSPSPAASLAEESSVRVELAGQAEPGGRAEAEEGSVFQSSPQAERVRAAEVLPAESARSSESRGAGGNHSAAALPRLSADQGLKTRWTEPWTPRPQDMAAAIETLSDGSVDPRWLVYMSPSISVCGVSQRAGLLEHPAEALQFYRSAGIQVAFEELHCGVRAVFVLGADETACQDIFGIQARGMIYDGAGRAFFEPKLQEAMLLGTQQALERVGAFERLQARVLIFEAIVQPWSLKRQEQLARNILPAAATLLASRSRALEALEQALQRRLPVKQLRDGAARDREAALAAQRASAGLVWPVKGAEGIKLAPLHLLGSERRSYLTEDRRWQAQELDRWLPGWSQWVPTRRIFVTAYEHERAVMDFWDQIQQRRGAGLLVRSVDPLPRHAGRLEAPLMKVRTREFLRVVYGPQYLNPDMLQWLRERPVRQLRQVCAREWALAAEGLDIFPRGEGFASYHPFALGVLASQNELIDPRR